jgi:four helix bundle protein
MRDPHKLKVFELADELALAVYRYSANLPDTERLGLAMQMRRAAASIPSSIAEGCSRHAQTDYLRFLETALGSASELEYQLSLAVRLGYLTADHHRPVAALASRTAQTLINLIGATRKSGKTGLKSQVTGPRPTPTVVRDQQPEAVTHSP